MRHHDMKIDQQHIVVLGGGLGQASRGLTGMMRAREDEDGRRPVLSPRTNQATVGLTTGRSTVAAKSRSSARHRSIAVMMVVNKGTTATVTCGPQLIPAAVGKTPWPSDVMQDNPLLQPSSP